MKSVFGKLLLWSLAVIALSTAAFLLVSRNVSRGQFEDEGPIRRDSYRQYREAKLAYEQGGKAALSGYLEAEKNAYPGVTFFLVRNGKDLVTGADRARTLSGYPGWSRFGIVGPRMQAVPSVASEYALLIVISSSGIGTYLPYYFLNLGAVVLLCWLVAFHFASPLAALKATVTSFGAGDLSARARSQRTDELGQLSNAFDEMANRMQRSLTSERRLLQDISHELRSPLARLRFALALARTAPDRDAAMARADKEIDRIASLLESLLQVTRVESDPGMSNAKAVVAMDVVSEVVDDCHLEADAAGCHLVLSASPAGSAEQNPADDAREASIICADPELLRRALENVLRNAIRYAPPASIVEIAVNRLASTVRFDIRDHGPGVPPGELENIFKPFFRVDNSRNQSTGGVGLGLAIVERAVKAMEGRVWAEKAQPGLRVVIELPLATITPVGNLSREPHETKPHAPAAAKPVTI